MAPKPQWWAPQLAGPCRSWLLCLPPRGPQCTLALRPAQTHRFFLQARGNGDRAWWSSWLSLWRLPPTGPALPPSHRLCRPGERRQRKGTVRPSHWAGHGFLETLSWKFLDMEVPSGKKLRGKLTWQVVDGSWPCWDRPWHGFLGTWPVLTSQEKTMWLCGLSSSFGQF